MQLLHVHLDLQKGATVGLSDPRLINTHISQQMKAATGAVRGLDPGDAMFAFLTDMQQLSSVVASSTNYINISTIFSATAKVWVAAQSNSKFAPGQQEAFRHVMALLASLLQMLQPMMPEMGAQAVSNSLWSSAKLGFHLDSLKPGVTIGLMTRFLQLAAARDTAKQPNAQATTNVFWAVATMKLQLPSHLINKCCGHLETLISSSRVADRPNAQNIANFVWAIATLEHIPSDRGFVSSCCNHFSQLISSRAIAEQPNAQDIANLLWGLAAREFAITEAFLDSCCNHFSSLINSLADADRPNAQCISNVLWALYKFKHAPSRQVAKAMVERMVALCRLPGQQDTLQAISNVMLACADLRLAIDPVCIETLVSVFLNLSRQQAVAQQYYNIAWSLAVLGLLRMETLNLLLCGLSDMHLQHDELLDGATNPFPVSALTQLYQAWDWLQPLPGAPALQHQAWSQLEEKLSSLGGRPPPSMPHPGTPSVCAALARLNLQFKASQSVGSYSVAAILVSDGSDVPIVLSLQRPNYLKIRPSRRLLSCCPACNTALLGGHVCSVHCEVREERCIWTACIVC